MAKTIKIKRTGDVFQSESEAIAFLSRTPHLPGQPILVRYWASDTETDAILAVGTQAGLGPGTYSIVSVGGIRVIFGIVTSEQDLPDASQLVNGETWLYQEPVTNDLYWIYLYESTRDVTPVDPRINYRVFCLSDNSEYWMYGGSLEKANNYYSREAIDQRISELVAQTETSISNLSRTVDTKIQGVKETIGINSGYPGTVQGATSLDDADRILQSRINQASQSLQGLSNRISDLEREFTSDTDGMTTTTRLDTLYSWYDEVTHVPSGSIRFIQPDGPLTKGSLIQIRVAYSWSWADRASWSGLRLNSDVRPFGTNDIPGASVPSGYYEWIAEVVLNGTITLEASFEGSSDEPVSITIEPDPVVKNIEISWPTQTWNSREFTYQVDFEGSGLPLDGQGNELAVWQDNSKVYQAVEGQGPTQKSTYIGTLNPRSPEISMRATWNNVVSEAVFRPTYLVVIPKNTEINTASLEASDSVLVSYQEDSSFETPEITYGPDQTLVMLSPWTFKGSKIRCISGGSEPLIVTSEFTSPDTIEYGGVTYNYISFPKIGAGTFKFIIE